MDQRKLIFGYQTLPWRECVAYVIFSISHLLNFLKIRMSEEKKEVKPESSEHISIKVQGQDGGTVQFKIKKNTALRKLMHTFAERQGLNINSIRFMFEGSRINDADTPASLEMEEDDQIEVYTEQTGGVLCRH